jgi:hypothetical protein
MIEDRVAAETDVVTKVSYYSPAALAASHHLTAEWWTRCLKWCPSRCFGVDAVTGSKSPPDRTSA